MNEQDDRADEADGGAYEVGYGRPPKNTQFKKGQSGNPSGRPRRPPSLRESFSKALLREIGVTTHEGPARMSMMEVISNSIVKRAAEGSVGMTKLATTLIRDLEIGEDTHAADLSAAEEAQFDELLAILSERAR